MNSFFPRSLKTKVVVFTLVIFLAGLWTLTLLSGAAVRKEMESELSSQQMSSVTFMSKVIDASFEDRLQALELLANEITPELLADTEALQLSLPQHMILNEMFNHGYWVADTTGTAIANVGGPDGRLGTNYGDRDFMQAALKEGLTNIGKPVRGRVDPSIILFVMAAPVYDAEGNVIAATLGVTNLGKPSFLDSLTQNRYGRTGDYRLVDGQDRLIVIASDKETVAAPFPEPGMFPAIDRFGEGFEGSQIYVSPDNIEVLASAKSIPSTGWYLSATMPTAEAFAPADAMMRQILLISFVLTILAGGLTSWVLHRQLSPLGETAKELNEMARSEDAFRELPVYRRDEIGTLIQAFNRLLSVMAKRDLFLREQTERRRQAQEEAEAANISKSHFLANMSHEIGLVAQIVWGIHCVNPA